MTIAQLTVFAILFATLVLFAWGRLRHDVVAIVALLSVAVFGLVPATEIFDGFGHPAVITVAAVLVISQALKNSGVVDAIAKALQPLTARPTTHMLALTASVAVASAFMNNVGALALMLPVALATAAEHKRSPAMLLMPLAFGSILGGMTTMIGTPPNVIIATYRAELGEQPFGMFEFSPVGVPVAVVGVLFVVLLGWRLIPRERLERNPPQQLFQIEEYLTEVRVPADNSLVGQTLEHIPELHDQDIDVIGLARANQRAEAISRYHVIEPEDVFLLRADPAGLKAVLDELGLELVTTGSAVYDRLSSEDREFAEGLVTPGALLEGRNRAFLRLHSGGALALVAMARQGETLRTRLRRQRFRAGDILLLQGAADALRESMGALGLLPLASRDLGLARSRRIGVSLSVFAVAILLGVLGMLPLTVTFVAAIVVYVLLGIIPIRDLYKEVDWPVIVLLGAMIPVGRALEATGATDLVATLLVSVTAGLPVAVILTVILVTAMFVSDVVNNAATALVMAPVALSVSQQLGVNPDAFLMAVAVGASCAFLTPIGHQSNTLVMGPGGYRFSDYWRMGLPLEILIVVLAVPLLLIVWPL